MTHKVPPGHPLRLFFAGAIENAFYTELGLCAPDVVAYLTDLLTDFIHVRDIYALRSVSGDTLKTVCDMIDKAFLGRQLSPQDRDRLIHRHVGDYTLYWTGLYPESFQGHHDFAEGFAGFCERGRESYLIASELSAAEDQPPASVLHRLSSHFTDCAQGLTIARRIWAASEGEGPEAP